jgi:hypothetical protein
MPEKSTQSTANSNYPLNRESFEKFWPFYVGEHLRPLNRQLHFVGSALALTVIFLALFTQNGRLLLAAPVAGYFFAWLGHFVVEGNRPATFKAPWLSLRGDWRMFRLMLTGRMQAEVDRLFPRRD